MKTTESNTSQESAKKTDKETFFKKLWNWITLVARWIGEADEESEHHKLKKEHVALSDQLVEVIDLGAPFTAVKHGNEWFLCIGKYRLTDGLKSLKEVKEEKKDTSWLRVMQIMQIMINDDYANRNNSHVTKGQ